MSSSLYDLIIIGGGIIGLTLAREWKRRFPRARVILFEKEADSISHGSGRNSGVIHSGIYYTPGSLRARLCVEGAQQMRDYVDEFNIWSDPCGKVLIPTSEQSFQQIDNLLQRAGANGVVADDLDARQLAEIEPQANTEFGRGIFIPATRVTDPKAVVAKLTQQLTQLGVEIRYQEAVTQIGEARAEVLTAKGRYQGDRVVNAAGLFADRVAESAGLHFRYEFQPFKGKYWKYAGPPLNLRRLIYAVPDLNLPFLGVHSVHNRAGDLYFGPSSTPVLGRVNYRGLEGLEAEEAISLGLSLSKKMILNRNGLRDLAMRELGLMFKTGLTREIQALVPGVLPEFLTLSATKVGIRSQIFDPKAASLVTDFVVIPQGPVLHVLNAISPAFSASFAFANYLADQLTEPNPVS